MSETRDIRWLLVGTGDIVRKRVAEALSSCSGSRIAGVVGGIDRATDLSDRFGGEPYADLDEALERCDPDAVYIATPVHRHRPEALAAISRGKAVLIEKPLGLNGREAQIIADAASSAGVVAGCAYYRRCFPRYQNAKEAISNGELGTITLVRTTYHGWFAPASDDPKTWRVDSRRSGGGPLADMGSHMFDLLIDLFGMPKSVFGYTGTLVQGFEVEDSSAIVMTLQNNAHVLASFGWNSKTWVHEFEIVGSEARLRWCPADTGKVVMTTGRDSEDLELPNASNVHVPLIMDFVNALRTGQDPICPLNQATKTNLLLDAIYESSRSGQTIEPEST